MLLNLENNEIGGERGRRYSIKAIQSLYATVCSCHLSLKFGITLVMRIRQIYNQIGEILFSENIETLLVLIEA